MSLLQRVLLLLLYPQPVTYTVDNSTIQVLWEDYNDPESGIETFEVSLWNSTSCSDQLIQTLLHDWIELTNNYTEYSFVDLQLQVCFTHSVVPLILIIR